MPATLDTDALARALGDAAVLTSEGCAYPIAIEYDEAGAGRYPKHAWPEDPLAATPSTRPGRRP